MSMHGGKRKSAVEGSWVLTLGTNSLHSLTWAGPHWLSPQNKMCKLVLNSVCVSFFLMFFQLLSSAGRRDPAAYLVFLSGQLVPSCLVFPLLLIFFTKGEITDRFLGLWAMFSPSPACWRNVASKLCVFPRNAFLSARWAVALLLIHMFLPRLCTSNARRCFVSLA